MIILLILFVAFLEASLIPLVKKFVETKKYLYLFILALFFIISVICYIFILQNRGIITTHFIVNIMALFIVIAYGYFMFNEKITPKIIIGLILGVIAIYLLC